MACLQEVPAYRQIEKEVAHEVVISAKRSPGLARVVSPSGLKPEVGGSISRGHMCPSAFLPLVYPGCHASCNHQK